MAAPTTHGHGRPPRPTRPGAAITPFVLGRIAEATDGRSIPANLALAENNARVAAQVAVAIAGRLR